MIWVVYGNNNHSPQNSSGVLRLLIGNVKNINSINMLGIHLDVQFERTFINII